MKDNLLEIINYNGVVPQLKHFHEEVFEFTEAILRYEEWEHMLIDDELTQLKAHITEEIADNLHHLLQFIAYYRIPKEDIEKVLLYKNQRTRDKIKRGEKI